MTPEAQRIAIAEWCGWRWKDSTVTAFGATKPLKKWHDSKGRPTSAVNPLPDYLNDLNAIHEAERSLTTQQLHVMNELLYCDIVPKNERVFRATAAQRSEALLRTIGKWTDTKEAGVK